MRKINQCYMCDSQATSEEHVPPKCIFPEAKDVNGIDFRKNLITVPSCELHNTGKSKDDEFLMVSLAGIVGNNSIGYQHKFGKVNRALKRRSYRFLDEVFKDRKHYQLKGKNQFLEIIWGTPDYDRLSKSFTHIAHGIYFHHFQERFIGETKMFLGYLHSQDIGDNYFIKFMKHRAEIDLRDSKMYGENPKVFYYQFTKEDLFGIFLLHLRFYGGVDVYISFIPEGRENPYHLGFELMKLGVETTLMLEGKEYKINEK